MKSPIEFHANGKLLISGEYLVLSGAKALAMPVRFGQHLVVEETNRKTIDWESYAPGGMWFHASFDPRSLDFITTNNPYVAAELKNILIAVRIINTGFMLGTSGVKVEITANYPLEWGLGSSSTLCALIAAWAGVEPFALFQMISQGSGYDIACAIRSQLLFYHLIDGEPVVSSAVSGNALRENTWFAYLGKKQNTAKEVKAFRKKSNYAENDLEEVSRLSDSICQATSANELIRLIKAHEHLLSSILKRKPIAGSFPSFPGAVKSLGAWGGDFAMFVSGMDPDDGLIHLRKLGFSTIFTYSDLEIKI